MAQENMSRGEVAIHVKRDTPTLTHADNFEELEVLGSGEISLRIPFGLWRRAVVGVSVEVDRRLDRVAFGHVCLVVGQ